MLWRFIEKKVKKNFYPDLYFGSYNVPRCVRTSVYKKYGLNIRFEILPERWSPMLYYWYFGKHKGYHYPTDDDIQFFYWTLFKKNGFLFSLLCCIVYKDCFPDLIILLLKSGITFYLIVYFIYIILFIRKIIKIIIKILRVIPFNCIPTSILVLFNELLNILKKKKERKWYF